MNYRTKQGIVYFTLFVIILLGMLYIHFWEAALAFGFCIFMGVLVILFPNANVRDDNEVSSNHTNIKTGHLTYYGDELNFAEADIIVALIKHLPYYSGLNEPDQKKFIKRLNKFIDEKTFKIYDHSGFREMPMLISAAAIQLSFGLDKYLLPNFSCINIYPEEFVEVTPTIRFLEGNVSGHNINISWKYFLRGFQLPGDGENVGLHEMAHAYYYQSFGPCDEKDNEFVHTFNKFNTCGNDVFKKLSQSVNGMYTEYAKRNFQEFWAESVEIFFEKPLEMRNTYPLLYQSVSDVLKQDPANKVTWMQ